MTSLQFEQRNDILINIRLQTNVNIVENNNIIVNVLIVEYNCSVLIIVIYKLIFISRVSQLT